MKNPAGTCLAAGPAGTQKGGHNMSEATPSNILSQQAPADFISTNYKALVGYAKKQYGYEIGEDIAHSTIGTILDRAGRGLITFCTWGYFVLEAKTAHRDLQRQEAGEGEQSYDKMHDEHGFDVEAAAEPGLDERLEILRDDYRFTEAIEKILQGGNITKAVVSYGKFRRKARQAVVQPRLF